jgi:hypothetical protein
MAGRGSTTFQKRQKEQQRKEKRAEKLARRQGRKLNPVTGISDSDEPPAGPPDAETEAGPETTVDAETGVAPVPE